MSWSSSNPTRHRSPNTTSTRRSFGAGKATAIAATVDGSITATVPGSCIELHADVTVVVDEAAATRFGRAGYHRWVYEHEPAWQGL